MQQVLSTLGGYQRLFREAFAGTFNSAGSHAHVTGAEIHPVQLCDTTVCLRVRQAGEGGSTYISLHENEKTAVQAAAAVLEHHPGRLIELRSRGRRYVTFRNGLRPFAFDPNRIFTPSGVEATLRRYQSATASALAAVGELRDAVLRLIGHPADAPVVALHNNGGRYSIHQYEAGGVHARDAQAVSVSRDCSPEDFFVTTRGPLFEALSGRGFNAVWQSDDAADDGSLSVWFQRHGRPYINVEARHGHFREQQRMLLAAAELIR